MAGRKVSLTMRYVLAFGILLFMANVALGLVILGQSKDAMKTLINKNMLDVVKSAAGSLDGDVLGALTADDVDGPVFRDIEDRLLVFQNSVDVHFIYAVKQAEDGTFVFTVDPDPVDPGDFGEEVLTTPALISAGKGEPTVDESPAEDRWGNLYSAFCPVFDASGKVAGIVGVDFDAEWYNAQVQKYSITIATVTAVSVLLGGIVIALISRRVSMKLRELDAGVSDLSKDMDVLMAEVTSYSDFTSTHIATDTDAGAEQDELEILGDKIKAMKADMGLYLEYLHTQAYVDSLTKVGSSTAYHELIHDIDEKINRNAADFYVLVFDVNSLKQLNDTYGHECGDEYIVGTAQALTQGLGDAHIYRIGGDEFAIVAEGYDQAQIDEGVRKTMDAVASFNEHRQHPAKLAISHGVAHFEPEQDATFKDVFARADKEMYADKRLYYQTLGDRRRRS